jgi:peptide/nickel transport system substrate-binding protein
VNEHGQGPDQSDQRVTRRQFVRAAGATAVLLATAGLLQACGNSSGPAVSAGPTPSGGTAPAPAVTPAPASQAAPQVGGVPTLVLALTSWGTEIPLPWKSQQAEKPLFDIMHEELVLRDPKTYQFMPGLAEAWEHSDDYRTWTFHLRQGVMFHGTWGELTSQDVKYQLEQHLKPENPGGDVPYFRAGLDGVDTPDKYTAVLHFKVPSWDVVTHFAQMTGYQNITSRAYVESVGDDKASQAPIGTGAYRHVESLQGQYHTFEAVPNHWRVKQPGFKRVTIRRILEPATALAALRAGEVDIIQLGGDNIDQAKNAGFTLHETPGAVMHWLILPGQTIPGKDDYQPQLTPWAENADDAASVERATQVRLALNLAVNKKAIYDEIYRGHGGNTPFAYWYFPINKGYSTEWTIEPYDPSQAKKILADLGYSNGFTISMNTLSAQVDSQDIVEAVAEDWEKIGLTVNRAKEDPASFLVKIRSRKTGETGMLYAPPSPLDEPSLLWQRTMNSRGPLYLLAEGPFDQALDQIAAELDPDKRTPLTVALANRLVQEHRGIRIGIKSALWGVSKKVGNWPTLTSVQYETNLDLITPA